MQRGRPGRAPVRRLTTYEYNNTMRDLLGDTTSPGTGLPAQVDSKENPFGNDADEQSPSSLLIEKYQSIAEADRDARDGEYGGARQAAHLRQQPHGVQRGGLRPHHRFDARAPGVPARDDDRRD